MKSKIVANDKEHLESLIKQEIRSNGYKCSLNHIDVSNINDMSSLFSNSQFNGDISKWDTSNVENMRYMFQSSEFNGDISKWDVSKVWNMSEMFFLSKFNQDISKWDVSNVIDMENMFNASPFNQDISSWNVSKVIYMDGIFWESPFNKDLSKWKPFSLETSQFIFDNSSVPIPYWVQYEDKKDRETAIHKYMLSEQLNEELHENNNSSKRTKI